MRAPSRKTVPRKNASTGPSPTVHAKAKPKTTQTQQAVAAELDHLRMILREISTLFADRLESEIVQIHEAVLSCPRSPTRRPALSKMRGLLSRLSIRPEKGRRKDLKRIDRLVAELNKIARTL